MFSTAATISNWKFEILYHKSKLCFDDHEYKSKVAFYVVLKKKIKRAAHISKGGLIISEGILTLVTLPKKCVKSRPWAENLKKLLIVKGGKFKPDAQGRDLAHFLGQFHQSQNTLWNYSKVPNNSAARLFIFKVFSYQHALIWTYTVINFSIIFLPTCLLSTIFYYFFLFSIRHCFIVF